MSVSTRVFGTVDEALDSLTEKDLDQLMHDLIRVTCAEAVQQGRYAGIYREVWDRWQDAVMAKQNNVRCALKRGIIAYLMEHFGNISPVYHIEDALLESVGWGRFVK